MPSTRDDIARARAWLGVFFDDLPEKIRPQALPHDADRRTCLRALDALEREMRRGVRRRNTTAEDEKQLTLPETEKREA